MRAPLAPGLPMPPSYVITPSLDGVYWLVVNNLTLVGAAIFNLLHCGNLALWEICALWYSEFQTFSMDKTVYSEFQTICSVFYWIYISIHIYELVKQATCHVTLVIGTAVFLCVIPTLLMAQGETGSQPPAWATCAQCGRKTPARRTLPPFGAECPTIASKTAVMMAVVVLACQIYKKLIEMGCLQKFAATMPCDMFTEPFPVCLNARYKILDTVAYYICKHARYGNLDKVMWHPWSQWALWQVLSCEVLLKCRPAYRSYHTCTFL